MTATNTPVVDASTILAGAHRIVPLLREQGAEVEASRRLTTPVVEALRSTGIFRMAMPHAWGGPRLTCSHRWRSSRYFRPRTPRLVGVP